MSSYPYQTASAAQIDDNRQRWAVYVPFRLASTAAAVLLFNQAVFAGQFLAGTFGALNTHREFATIAGLAVIAMVATAVLLRWPGRGPLWPAIASLGLFALVAVQITLGYQRILTFHVPLGVTIILLSALLAIWGWRTHPAPPRAANSSVIAAGQR